MKNFRNTRHWLLAMLLGCFATSAQAFVEGSDTFGSGTIVNIEPDEYYIYYTDKDLVDHFLYANNGTWTFSTTPQAITLSRGNIGISDGYAPYARTSAMMDSNGYRMTNPNGSGFALRTEPTSRTRTFESQVFYEKDGKYAIRTTNTDTSEWGADCFVYVNPDNLTLSAVRPYELGDALYLWTVIEKDLCSIDGITAKANELIASHTYIQCDILSALQEEISYPTDVQSLLQAYCSFLSYCNEYDRLSNLMSELSDIEVLSDAIATATTVLNDEHGTADDISSAYATLTQEAELYIIRNEAIDFIASNPAAIQCDVLTALQEQIDTPTDVETMTEAFQAFKDYCSSYDKLYNLITLLTEINELSEATDKAMSVLADVHSNASDIEAAYSEYQSSAESIINQFGGKSGDAYWLFNADTNTLSIFGKGVIPNYPSANSTPWRGCYDQINNIIIYEGVTRIGNYAFYGCSRLASITIPEGVTSIGYQAFYNCTSLASITIPEGVTSIGYQAFYNCTSLTSITLPEGLTSIGEYAFKSCSSLASITLPEGVTSIGEYAFGGCRSLASITLPEDVTSIGHYAFDGCSRLASITIPEGVTSIGNYAFCGCTSLASITIPESVPSIGSHAFYNCTSLNSITITGNNVPSYTLDQLGRTNATIYVAAGMYDEYMADERWAPYSMNIVSADMLELRTVDVTAKVGVSAIDEQIGEANRLYVGNLKVRGTINNYDIFAIRTKFLRLRDLDLSEADIVASDDHFQYYSGYYLTEDNQLGNYAFYDLDLRSVVLPNSLKSIGSYAFSNCKQLTTITLPDSVQSMGYSSFENCRSLSSIILSENLAAIPSNAFYNCSSLASIVIPNSIKSIGYEAFRGCSNLSSVSVGNSVESIGSYAFGYTYSCDDACRKLTQITLPTSVKTISNYAFAYSGLTELRIPSSVRTIGDQAFAGCPLTDVYTYIVEPQQINQNTFDVYTTAMLHVPSTSWALYDYNTQWGQFVNKTYFDEPYEYFYIDHDYTLDDATGRIDGDPDAELNEHSGLIVEGDDEQGLTDIDINHDGTDGPSIIADDNVTAESMTIHITLNGRSWKFFCFPYDIEYSDIRLVPSNDQFAGEIAMYTYNGALRALGQSGWVRVDPSETLIAGRGYIIQGSTNGTLDITIREENLDFSADDKAQEMEAFAASDDADASWNFMGNPYLSYYDLDALSEQFDSPITIWDGNQYLAYRPGDDNYQLHPFEAFFVQKPEKLPDIEFKGNNRITYTGAQSTGAANAARRRMASVNADRLLVNLTLTDGTVTDKTRVVFNEKASAAYERECDAAKFMSLNDVPQLWTLSGKTQYAINERPTDDGIVTLAYTATQEGTLTLRATRMDTPMVLCDRMTGTEFDLREGDYTFLTEAGTFADRFTLRRTAATAIGNARVNDEEDLQRFNAAGQAADADTKGVMILKQGDKVVKRYNK